MTPRDWLAGAKSVVVVGLRYHKQVLRWATRPPAEAVGPYAFETYVTNWVGMQIGYQLIQQLAAFGHEAVMTMDLTGAGSHTANPRGEQPDLYANRFAALAAGLGDLTVSGHLTTPQFGLRQRFVALVTDAELTATPLPGPRELRCATCDRPCVSTCPSQAIGDEQVTITCQGRRWSFHRIDPLRCDWVKRYALMAGSGFRFLGSATDIAPPPTITPEALGAALTQLDPIKRYRPAVAEPCVIHCPLATDA
jgi:epoxyqueuosine reductase QueG